MLQPAVPMVVNMSRERSVASSHGPPPADPFNSMRRYRGIRIVPTHVPVRPSKPTGTWQAAAHPVEGQRTSTPEDLQEIHTDELKDSLVRHDQMQKVVNKITSKASDPALKEMLTKSQEGSQAHRGAEGADRRAGLGGVQGALKGDRRPRRRRHQARAGGRAEEGPLLHVLIIAQYQRVTHTPLRASAPRQPMPKRWV